VVKIALQGGLLMVYCMYGGYFGNFAPNFDFIRNFFIIFDFLTWNLITFQFPLFY